MQLPFTVDQFLTVFSAYNTTVWPVQIGLNLIAVGIVVVLFSRIAWASRVTGALLAFLWGWCGIVYHIGFFARINPAANLFGIVFVLQAVLLLVFCGVLDKWKFERPGFGVFEVVGGAMIAYSIILYPLIGMFSGHAYPAMPTFGLPCPTTIFTLGVILLAGRRIPPFVAVIPVVWSMVGGSATFKLGIGEDAGLLLSGILTVAIMIAKTGAPAKKVHRGANEVPAS